jgi:hypothetical protein
MSTILFNVYKLLACPENRAKSSLTQLREEKLVSDDRKPSFNHYSPVRFSCSNADALAERKAVSARHILTPAVIAVSAGDPRRAGRSRICRGGALAVITATDIAIVAILRAFRGQDSAPQ